MTWKGECRYIHAQTTEVAVVISYFYTISSVARSSGKGGRILGTNSPITTRRTVDSSYSQEMSDPESGDASLWSLDS
jgi:hypothetical protein